SFDFEPEGLQRLGVDAAIGPLSDDRQGVVDAEQPVAPALDVVLGIFGDEGPVEEAGLACPVLEVVHPVAQAAGVAPNVVKASPGGAGHGRASIHSASPRRSSANSRSRSSPAASKSASQPADRSSSGAARRLAAVDVS